MPIFGEVEGVPFPQFSLALEEGQTDEAFVRRVEFEAVKLLGDVTEREYSARRSATGNMPRLNRCFEELKIKYEEHSISSKVRRAIDKRMLKETAGGIRFCYRYCQGREAKEGHCQEEHVQL